MTASAMADRSARRGADPQRQQPRQPSLTSTYSSPPPSVAAPEGPSNQNFKLLSIIFFGTPRHHVLLKKNLAAMLLDNWKLLFRHWNNLIVKEECRRLAAGSCKWPLAVTVAAHMFRKQIVVTNAASKKQVFGLINDPAPIHLVISPAGQLAPPYQGPPRPRPTPLYQQPLHSKKKGVPPSAIRPWSQPPPPHQMTLSDGESEWSDYESANEEGEVNTVSIPEVTKDAAQPGQKKSRSAKRRRRGTSPGPETTKTTPNSPPQPKKEKKAKIILPPAASSQPSPVTLPTYQPALATPTACSSTAAVMEPSTPPPASPTLRTDETELIKAVKKCLQDAENYHHTVCGPNVHPDWACRKVYKVKNDVITLLLQSDLLPRIHHLQHLLTPLLATFDNPEPFSLPPSSPSPPAAPSEPLPAILSECTTRAQLPRTSLPDHATLVSETEDPENHFQRRRFNDDGNYRQKRGNSRNYRTIRGGHNRRNTQRCEPLFTFEQVQALLAAHNEATDQHQASSPHMNQDNTDIYHFDCTHCGGRGHEIDTCSQIFC